MTPFRKCLVVAPAVGAALLPKIACPICWPLYASALSAIGVGFIPSTTYLFPLTAIFLLVAVGAFGVSARKRRAYGPLLLSFFGALLTFAGRFWAESGILVFSGIGMFISAAVWNAWPRTAATHLACSACAPDSEGMNKECHSKVEV